MYYTKNICRYIPSEALEFKLPLFVLFFVAFDDPSTCFLWLEMRCLKVLYNLPPDTTFFLFPTVFAAEKYHKPGFSFGGNNSTIAFAKNRYRSGSILE